MTFMKILLKNTFNSGKYTGRQRRSIFSKFKQKIYSVARDLRLIIKKDKKDNQE